jgi:NAD(P)H-dependent FMN reductase
MVQSARQINLGVDPKTTVIFFGGTDKRFAEELWETYGSQVLIAHEVINPSTTSTIMKAIKSAEIIIFACPEWNGSYPWFFKRLIDGLPENTLRGKTMKMIVWSSGNNKAENLRTSLIHLASSLKMNISCEWLYIDRVGK